MKQDISYSIAVMQDIYTEIFEGIVTGEEAKSIGESVIHNGYLILQDIETVRNNTTEFDEELDEWVDLISAIQDDIKNILKDLEIQK